MAERHLCTLGLVFSLPWLGDLASWLLLDVVLCSVVGAGLLQLSWRCAQPGHAAW